MPVELCFGENQLIVDRDLEPATRRGDKFERFNYRLELFEQVNCQTGSSIRVVSNRAVLDNDIHQHWYDLYWCDWRNYNPAAKILVQCGYE